MADQYAILALCPNPKCDGASYVPLIPGLKKPLLFSDIGEAFVCCDQFTHGTLYKEASEDSDLNDLGEAKRELSNEYYECPKCHCISLPKNLKCMVARYVPDPEISTDVWAVQL